MIWFFIAVARAVCTVVSPLRTKRILVWRERLRGAFNALSYSIVITLLIGVAVVLGNSVTSSQSNVLLSDGSKLNQYAEIFAFVAGGLQLFVFLAKDRLFQSERGSAKTWQKWLAGAVSLGVAILLPFAMVHWMAREDMSGYTQHRDPYLVRQDFQSWDHMGLLATLADIAYEKTDDPNIEKLKELDKNITLLNTCRDEQDKCESKRQKLVPVSRWQRFNPGPSVSAPKTPFRNENKDKLIGSDFDRLISFPRVMSYHMFSLVGSDTAKKWIGSDIFKMEKLLKSRRKSEELFLGKFNGALGTREFLALLLTQVPSSSDNTTSHFTSWFGLKGETLNARELVARYTSSQDKVADQLKIYIDDKEKLMELASDIQAALTEKKESRGNVVNRAGDIAAQSRKLLRVFYPSAIKPQKIASTATVVEHDQQARLRWAITFSILALLGYFGALNLNMQNAIFEFYRKRLNEMFLQGYVDRSDSKAQNSVGDPTSHPFPIPQTMRLTDCDVTEVGLPYPLLLGTWMERRAGVPHYEPFVFSPENVGIPSRTEMTDSDWTTQLQDTKKYRLLGHNRGLHLCDVVAISGAAVTPFMTRHLGLASILDFFGVGLGQWMRRPDCKDRNKAIQWGYLSVFTGAIKQAFWNSHEQKIGFVADGGFEDVLGAYELLRRGCELIIVSDACRNTNQDELGALAKLLESANTNLGIRFLDLDHESPIDYGRLVKNEDFSLPQNQIIMRVQYPNGRSGLMVYMQMGITENDPIEIRQIKKKFPSFPDEPTANQFYTPDQVLAYQRLGYYIGEKICSELVRWEPDKIMLAEKHRQFFTHQEREIGKRNNQNTNNSTLTPLKPIDREFYGDALDFHENFDAPNIGVPPTKQPLFDVIKKRLCSAYRMACFEEDDYSTKDIFSEAVWDRNEWCFISLKNCVDEELAPLLEKVVHSKGFEGRLTAIHDVCAAWLKVFQSNSDVAAVYRNTVFLDVNSGMLSEEDEKSRSLEVFNKIKSLLDGNRNATSDLIESTLLAAHFSVVAIACQQFHRGLPRAIFQIGGSAKLLDCLLYTSPSPRDATLSRMPSSA